MPWVDVLDPRTGLTSFARATNFGDNFSESIIDRTQSQVLLTYCSAVPVLDYAPSNADPETLRATVLKTGYSLLLMNVRALWFNDILNGYNNATGPDAYIAAGRRFRLRAQTYGIHDEVGETGTKPSLRIGIIGDPQDGGYDVGQLQRFDHRDSDNGDIGGSPTFGDWHEFTTAGTAYGPGFSFDSNESNDLDVQFAVQIEEFVEGPDPPEETSYNCECDDPNPSRTLAELRTEMLIRLGFAANLAEPGPGMVPLMNSFLQGAQRSLYRQYKVLRTERYFTWNLLPGVRFYDLAENADTCTKELDPRAITWAGISRDAEYWQPLVCGIPATCYSSPLEIGWPTRYEIRQCIEVWPAPSDTHSKLRIKGHFGLERFTEDDDQCTVDDEAVFLFALARAKAHLGHPDARNYQQDAQVYMRKLVAGTHQTRRYVSGETQRPRAPESYSGVDWSQFGGAP